MNPASVIKLMGMKKEFENRHPRAVSFVEKELLGEIPEGTVMEISLTRPDQKTITANLRVTREDLDMLEELKQLKR